MNRRNSLVKSLVVAATVVLYASAVAVAEEHEHALKVGKTGEVTLQKETIVGNMTLKPGRYQFQHRVEGEEHFVHFTEWTKQNPLSGHSGEPKAQAGEVKCQVEPLNKKVSDTTLFFTTEGGTQRLVKVEIEGENVVHVL
jgi:hypothetical protein